MSVDATKRLMESMEGSQARSKRQWPHVAFGDVVKLNKDRIADPLAEGVERYVGIEHIEPEDLRIRSWGLVADGTTFTNQFRPGQVLFVKRRAYQRKVALADFEGVCSGDIYVLESKDPDVLLPDLLPFICQTDGFFEHAVGTSAGSLSPRTNWKQLAAYEFPLPPLAEQRRIADVLGAAEATRQEASHLHLLAMNLLSSVRAELVQPEFNGISRRIGDIAFLKLEREEVVPTASYTIVGIYSFGRGLLERGPQQGSKTKYAHFHRVREGQIVVSKLKAWEGAVAIVESQHDGAYVSSEYPTYELDRDQITPAYMKQVCASTWFWRNINSHSRGTAERRARINPNDFLKVSVSVPPLSMQEEIVKQLNKVQEMIDSCSERSSTASEIKRALLESQLGCAVGAPN